MNNTSPNIHPMTRRALLQRSAVGFGSLALASMLANESSVSAASADPLAAKRPHFPARAKRIIFLLMGGGPSQVDTFDPKPLLTRDDGKPLPFAKPRVQFNAASNLLKSPWRFRQSGESGLLDDTLVWWGSEFGRTPTAERTKDGRDHNPEGFTMWLAGGGVKGGFRYGSTDDYGYYAQDDKVHIHDLRATILHLLGLDHERLTYRHAGRDFRLTDVEGNVVKEIFA